jgi:hypothetical protein
VTVDWQKIKKTQTIHAYLQMYGLLQLPCHPGGKVRGLWIYNDLVRPVSEVRARYSVQDLQLLRADKETS